MRPLLPLLLRHLVWVQAILLVLLGIVLVTPDTPREEVDAASELQLLGNLALPYLISGDRQGLRQTLDLVIQGSPVLEAGILNTENQPLIQVLNRSATDSQRREASQYARELVLDRSLLGTLSISLPAVSPPRPWLPLGLAALILALVLLGFWSRGIPVEPAAQPIGSSTPRPRLLVSLSLSALIPGLREGDAVDDETQQWLAVLRRLAPNYGLDFLTISDEMLVLQSRADDAQSLRQAVVFAWNFCQLLGAGRGVPVAAAIVAARLPGDTLAGNLGLLREDLLAQSEDLLAYGGSGNVVLSQRLAALLPRDWSTQFDNDRQLGVINELPAPLCTLWRRQIKSLEASD